MAIVFLVAGLFCFCLGQTLPELRLGFGTLGALSFVGWFLCLLPKEKDHA